MNNEIIKVKDQLVTEFNPAKVVLFGSYAKGNQHKTSDIDLCVIKDTADKRSLLTDMYLKIDSDKPIDILLYTKAEWNECITDATSFAYNINKQGVALYG